MLLAPDSRGPTAPGVAFEGLLRLVAVTAIVAIVSGAGNGLMAPERTIHLGASGVVFGYATCLIAHS